MKKDKINDEFIVDCTNNTTEERQRVYKFLVDNRGYYKAYLNNDYPLIVCNKKPGDSNWNTLEQYYNWFHSKKDLPVYSFEKFKEMYLEEQFILPEMWCVKVTKENAKLLGEFYAKHSYEGYERIFPEQFIGRYATSHNVSSHNSLFSEYPGSNFDIPYPKNNFVEITFEQFKKYILKQTEMEKEVEYYLCKKLCWGKQGTKWNKNDKLYSTNLDSLPYFKETGLINNTEYWEAVYKEEFQAGDWVTVTKLPETAHWIHETEERTFQLNGVNKFYSCTYKNNIYKERYGLEKCTFRKATPEEIEKASKTIVKMYSSNKGEFEIEVLDGKAYYRPEDKELPKEWIRDIINSYGNILIQKNVINPYNVEISSINVGCYHNCKKEDWENVYKLLK